MPAQADGPRDRLVRDAVVGSTCNMTTSQAAGQEGVSETRQSRLTLTYDDRVDEVGDAWTQQGQREDKPVMPSMQNGNMMRGSWFMIRSFRSPRNATRDHE